jgi:hypothetical protein
MQLSAYQDVVATKVCVLLGVHSASTAHSSLSFGLAIIGVGLVQTVQIGTKRLREHHEVVHRRDHHVQTSGIISVIEIVRQAQLLLVRLFK